MRIQKYPGGFSRRLMYIIDTSDITQEEGLPCRILLSFKMILSKSFGYALRSVLYIAALQEEKRVIQLQEIAKELGVPRHFLGKVMKRLSKKGIIDSSKGHAGGYTLNETTLSVSVMEILSLIEGEELFQTCVIGFKKCNPGNPCPLHNEFVETKNQMQKIFSETTIGELLKEDKPAFIRSLVTA